jgi:hypothetical protein
MERSAPRLDQRVWGPVVEGIVDVVEPEHGASKEACSQVYSGAAAFIAEVRAAMAAAMVSETGDVGDGAGQDAPESLLRSLAEFHRDPRYAGDLHRADMAWARHAAAIGLSATEIRAEIMRVRDLSKKGNLKRRREYAERTAGKAVRQAE